MVSFLGTHKSDFRYIAEAVLKCSVTIAYLYIHGIAGSGTVCTATTIGGQTVSGQSVHFSIYYLPPCWVEGRVHL
jgi:hypothetical protein